MINSRQRSIFLLIALAAACTQAKAPPRSSSVDRLIQVHNGIEMEVVAAYRDAEDLWITLCYQQPGGTSWVPGRHADDASVTAGGVTYPMSSLEFIGFRASSEGLATFRCDRFLFAVPELPPGELYHLTIARLVGEMARAEDCLEVQRRLEEQHTEIKIECLPDEDGFFSFGLIERPENLTDLEASYVVDDVAGEVVDGPWEFTFTIAGIGE